MEQRAFETLTLMDRADYRRWAATQPRGRFERVCGKVIAMAPERMSHIRVKLRVWRALDDAVQAAGVPCEAIGDGATVEVGADTDYEPDAVVNCGQPLRDDAIVAPNPIVIVEVLSPSTQSVDTGTKLTGYFQIPSVRHYLVVRADRMMVTHHHRRADGGIETTSRASGAILLDPPGVTVAVEDFYRRKPQE